MRGWKKIFHANGNQKKAGVAIFISDKIDLRIKKITRDKEVHYIMIKESIQEEDITIVNIYASNIGAPKYIRQTLTNLKGKIDSNTIVTSDQISRSVMSKSLLPHESQHARPPCPSPTPRVH